jgi:hypothetical protein
MNADDFVNRPRRLLVDMRMTGDLGMRMYGCVCTYTHIVRTATLSQADHMIVNSEAAQDA